MLPCRFAQTSAAVLLAGTAVLRLLARGTDLASTPRWNRLAWGSWGVLLIAAVLQLGLTAAEMSGQPLARAFSPEVLGGVLDDTGFGAVWKVRAGLLASLGFVEGLTIMAQRRGGGRWVAASLEPTGAWLAAGLLASLVWSGHAGASDQRAWLLPVDVLHAVAAGAWPGGLLPLGLLLADARRDRRRLLPAVTITRRFSRLSMAAVGVLSFSGLLNGVGLVGTPGALWPSVYGRLLLCKAALLVGMVALGALNRRLIRPETSGEEAARTLRRLWRHVAWECALAVGVLLATEALAMNAPPASAG